MHGTARAKVHNVRLREGQRSARSKLLILEKVMDSALNWIVVANNSVHVSRTVTLYRQGLNRGRSRNALRWVRSKMYAEVVCAALQKV